MAFFLYLWAAALLPWHLVRKGTPTVGRITDKYSGHSYCLKYTFRTAKGLEKERPDYVPRRVYERASVGDEVVVVYQVDGAGHSDIYDFSDYEAK